MGFFSDLKEDLSQAVNELMPEEEKNKADEPAAEPEVSLDEMLKNIDDFQLPEETEIQSQGKEESVAEEAGSDAAMEEMLAKMLEQDIEGGQEEAMQPETAQYGEAEPESAQPEAAQYEETELGAARYGEAEPESVQPEAAQYEETELGAARYGEAEPESAQFEEPQYGAAQQQEEAQGEVMPEETAWNETIIEESKGEEEEMDMEAMELVRDREVSDETSVITQGMTITGDISTQGSIDVIGTVNGNIDALGKLNITGHVNGNSKAAEIYAESAKINGEILSEGAVKIGASSVIIGNITATSAAVAGAVKGDIDVKGPVILDASAIVMGNIKSKSVQINNGAVIEGMCSQCYADVSPTSFFDEYKPEIVRKPKAKQA